jgi:hypothetical protein
LHAARQALEEWDAEQLLKVMDKFRCARLSEVHNLRRAMKIPVLPQRHQERKVAEAKSAN